MYLIVANWKMNPLTLKGAKRLFDSVGKGVKNIKGVEVVICPPFVYLSQFSEQYHRLVRGAVRLGSQDCFWENSGAFTGAVSLTMLKDLGCQYVILGHSERRRYFGETDEMINKKLKAAISAKLKPILCIGETEEQRKTGKTEKVLKTQLKLALKNLSFVVSQQSLVIAYEPVWAIGTGKACGTEEAKKANLFIQKITHQLINSSTNLFLYGGSVNSANAKDYIEKAGFQGLLVGGASLDTQEFIKIVRDVAKN